MEEAGLDTGPDRKAVTRMCALTRVVRPVEEMLRFVAGPDGQVVPDIRGILPGRGLWLGNSAETLQLAIKRKVFGRGLKQEITVPNELETQVQDLLRQDAVQMLALANKAGAVTCGFAKIEGMRGPILALIEAKDGSEAESQRLFRLCRGRGSRQSDPLVIRVFTGDEIALSLGREHVIHAAVTVHDAATAFVKKAGRYADFLSDRPAKP